MLTFGNPTACRSRWMHTAETSADSARRPRSRTNCKRLRQIARQRVNHGQRMQNSVFECHLDSTHAFSSASVTGSVQHFPQRFAPEALRFFNAHTAVRTMDVHFLHIKHSFFCSLRKNAVLFLAFLLSRPMWARGLKSSVHRQIRRHIVVAPHVGAWIEMPCTPNRKGTTPGRAPYGARGLKLLVLWDAQRPSCVAPRVGAWIEMQSSPAVCAAVTSRAPYGRAD